MNKKSLLFIAVSFLFIGTKAQVVPSPFWPSQNSNFSLTSASAGMLDVVDANVVWALNWDGTTAPFNEFTRTTNGGTTYTSGTVYALNANYIPASIEAIDSTIAWVTSYSVSGNMGALHTTTNGGLTWTNVTAVNMFTNAASFADWTCFLTPTLGITCGDPVAGEYEIHRTTDGGMTWTLIPGSSIANPTAGEAALTDSYTKFGTTDIWFGTNVGRVFHSNDGGLTWSVASTGSTGQISKLAFRDAMNGIVYTNSGQAYRTNTAGSTWTLIPADPKRGRAAICNVPGTTIYASCGYAAGNNVIAYSLDDGTTWSSSWGGMNVPYYEIEFVNNTVGYAGGISDFANAAIDGMHKYSGAPLALNNIGAPLANSFQVYPNPSSGNVVLDLGASKQGATITVIDVTGKIVYTETVQNMIAIRHNLNLEGLAKGIYSVNILRPTGLETSKIIIE